MASISLGLGAVLGGLAGGAGSITSGILGSGAAETASQEQTQEAQNALNFQEQVWNQQQQNQAPYLAAGQTSITQLMKDLGSGTFGPGSIPSFQAPTLAQAQQYPGFQFEQQQANKGILEASAAGGGAISGGTLKSIGQFDTNLANTTYGTLYNQALQTYGAQLSGQQQAFNQLEQPAALGEGSVQSLNNSGTATASNVGNLMTQIGNAQAAGTVGSTNAITNAISGGTSSLSQGLLLSQLGPLLGLTQGGSGGPGGMYNQVPADPSLSIPGGGGGLGNPNAFLSGGPS